MLRKLVGGTELSSNSEKSRDLDDTSSDAGSSSLGSQSTDELSDAHSQADTWLVRAQLLQSLLGSGIAASLDDIADVESSARLRDRLIVDERYSMAVYTCKKCKVIWIWSCVVAIALCNDVKYKLLFLFFSDWCFPCLECVGPRFDTDGALCASTCEIQVFTFIFKKDLLLCEVI